MNFIAVSAMPFSANFVPSGIFAREYAHRVVRMKARKYFQSFSGEKGT